MTVQILLRLLLSITFLSSWVEPMKVQVPLQVQDLQLPQGQWPQDVAAGCNGRHVVACRHALELAQLPRNRAPVRCVRGRRRVDLLAQKRVVRVEEGGEVGARRCDVL